MTDAVTHFEHGLLIRCDIKPRSIEITRVDHCTMPIIQAADIGLEIEISCHILEVTM
jgi:hypothetical protein